MIQHYIFLFVYYLPTVWSEGRGYVLLTADSPEPQAVSDIGSVQFSHSVVSDSLWPHESQHTRPPCPSPTPRAYPNSCPSSRWCHPTISPSVVPFSSCLQSFPVSGSFPMNQYLNHYCLLITLRASPACQPGHLHSTQASSFAAPWGGPFEGIPHSRLEAEHGCVLVLLTYRRMAP